MLWDFRQQTLSPRPVQGQYLQPRRKFFRLIHPVHDQAGRTQHQSRQLRFIFRSPNLQKRQGLQGLAQAHLIRQNTPEVIFSKVKQPPNSLALVGTNNLFQTLRKLGLLIRLNLSRRFPVRLAAHHPARTANRLPEISSESFFQLIPRAIVPNLAILQNLLKFRHIICRHQCDPSSG